VRSFVGGFGEVKDDGVLAGFQQWLTSQPQHRAISYFTWPSLLLHEVFPKRTRGSGRLREYLGSRPTSDGE